MVGILLLVGPEIYLMLDLMIHCGQKILTLDATKDWDKLWMGRSSGWFTDDQSTINLLSYDLKKNL